MSDHPAVLAHLDMISKAYPDYVKGKMSEEEYYNVPNHRQLVPYLEQLPREFEYRVLDQESGNLTQEESDYVEELENCNFGLEVNFVSPHEEICAYGTCRMVIEGETGTVGLRINVNGLEGGAPLPYFVMSVR